MNTECEARLKEQEIRHSMRVKVLEASLNDVKNQVEQVRKETAEDIRTELECNNKTNHWEGISLNDQFAGRPTHPMITIEMRDSEWESFWKTINLNMV